MKPNFTGSMEEGITCDATVENLGPYDAHFLVVPPTIGGLFTDKGPARVVCTLREGLDVHGALIPRREGIYVLLLSKAVRKKARLTAGQRLTVHLRREESPYGYPMPEVLREALDLDEQADAAFHALKPGRQRGIMYYIGTAKTVDTQIKRALEMIERMKSGNI